MAEIVYVYVYIFNLIWLMSLHYLVKGGCSKFVPNTGFVTVRLLRFCVKWRGHCSDNFLAQWPLPDMRRLPGDDFLMFQQDGTSAHQRATPRSKRQMRETRCRLSACVRVYGAYFEHEFWQFWADLSWQLITLLNKPYSVSSSSIGACRWRCCSCECPPSCSVLSSPKPWREAKIKLAQIFLHRP